MARGNSRKYRLFSCIEACQKRLVCQVEITLQVVRRAWTEQRVIALSPELKRHRICPDQISNMGITQPTWTEKVAGEQRIGLGQAATYRLNKEDLRRASLEGPHLLKAPARRDHETHSSARGYSGTQA